MLIRSQDKRLLLPMENFTVESFRYNSKPSILACSIIDTDSVSVVLGEYATEERTIEVLTEIQNTYLSCSCYGINNGITQHYTKNKVYEMPKE